MPEHSKKHKGKVKDGSKPKEQREARQTHSKFAEISEVKSMAKDEPAKLNQAPEFLKSSDNEVLKISEDGNSKYKKKEIVSNRAKYETEIETYEETEEKEEMGADYAKLIDASSSIGGHFQFKHEKSWDIATGPSLYDKYFDINMDKLADALNTIPFYERNDLDKSLFTEGDIINMDNKAMRAKQKYYSDRSFTTPDLQAQERILNSMTKTDTPIKKFQYTRLDELDDQFSHQSINEKPSEVSKDENITKDELPTLHETNQYEYTVVENVMANTVDDVTPKGPEAIISAPENPVIQSPEELEKWLDNLLEG